MKEIERYLGATYSDSCQPAIMNETPATFPDPEMTTVIPDTGADHPKTYVQMSYLKNKINGEAICQELRKEDIYGKDIHKIYNLMLGQKNKQIQEKAASDATFQAVNTFRDPIG